MKVTSKKVENNIKRCLAKTRSGLLCQNFPIDNKTRCRLHGGLSTGPKTPEGKALCIAVHWKHGKRSQSYVQFRKYIWQQLREVEERMRSTGHLPKH